LNLERLTIAINDDYVSEVGQTEILRLTSDNLVIKLDRAVTGCVSSEILCEQMQLDNQMFGSGEHGYDFPVIFLPRGGTQEKLGSPGMYFSFDGVTMRPELSEEKLFLRIKLKAILDGESRIKLTEVDFNLGSFEVYLEDFLIYSLMKIGIEFIGLATGKSKVEDVKESFVDFKYYDYMANDLGILCEPLIMLKKLHLG